MRIDGNSLVWVSGILLCSLPAAAADDRPPPLSERSEIAAAEARGSIVGEPASAAQAGAPAGSMEDGPVVRMKAENVSIAIEEGGVQPKRLEVSPGTTIVWVNKSAGPLKISFTGKAVSTTCKAPRGFSVGKAGVYVASEISPGGVASLCFLEPELYVYEVAFLGSDVSDADADASPRPLLVGSILVKR